MIPFLLSTMLSLNLGPMGADAPAHEPQMAAIGSTVALTFGAGNGIYFSSSSDAKDLFHAAKGCAGGHRTVNTSSRAADRVHQPCHRDYGSYGPDCGRRTPRPR